MQAELLERKAATLRRLGLQDFARATCAVKFRGCQRDRKPAAAEVAGIVTSFVASNATVQVTPLSRRRPSCLL